jgi:hypothetical protein
MMKTENRSECISLTYVVPKSIPIASPSEALIFGFEKSNDRTQTRGPEL